MNSTRTLLWRGDHFTTLCTFAGSRLTRFDCVYLIDSEQGVTLKKRRWSNGEIVSEAVLARCVEEWRWLFDAAGALLVARAGTIKERPDPTRSPLSRHTPQMGELVTCLRPIPAYYSHYSGNPFCTFEPGDIGVVGAVDVPAVRHNPENPSDLFACVDFEKHGLPPTHRRPAEVEWRCRMYYHQMHPLAPGRAEPPAALAGEPFREKKWQQQACPRVTASLCTDDGRVEVPSFDATPWFAAAGDEEIRALLGESASGVAAAGRVAQCATDYDPEVRELFTYLDILNRHEVTCGSACRVDQDQARAWLAFHRPHLLPRPGSE